MLTWAPACAVNTGYRPLLTRVPSTPPCCSLVNTSRHLSLAPRNYNHVIGDLLLNPSIPRWNTNVDEHIKMHIRIILLVVAAIALYHFLHTSRRELASHRAKTVAPWPLCFRLRVTLVSTFCSAAFHFFLPVCLSMQITHLVR